LAGDDDRGVLRFVASAARNDDVARPCDAPLQRNVTTRRANQSLAQKPVQPPRKKYFAFSETQISRSVRTVPPLRGALRNVTDAERDAVDAAARLTGEQLADGEVVWS
jgi:hypothetical protein